MEHLWFNLGDRFIGGGRKNWDGSGGTNGSLNHFVEMGEMYLLDKGGEYCICKLCFANRLSDG